MDKYMEAICEIGILKDKIKILEIAFNLACQKLKYLKVENEENLHSSQYWHDFFINEALEELKRFSDK